MDVEVSRKESNEAATAGLEDLGEVPVDHLVALIDDVTPGYRALYYRWEREQWEAGTIDFTQDRRQWAKDFSPELRRSYSWGLSSFYVAQHQPTDTLVPFVDAAPTEEQQVFLTTQLADVARHAVFFDRFRTDVLDERGEEIDASEVTGVRRLNEGLRILFLEMLLATGGSITNEGDLESLIEGVVLYHLVIEGAVALTAQRFLLDHARAHRLLPGFRRGFTAVARDQSRHVGFAVRFLHDMVQEDGRSRAVIEGALSKMVPVGMAAFDPPDGDMAYYEPLPYGPPELRAFALDGLATRSRLVGVRMTHDDG